MGTPINTKELARFVLPIVRKEWDQEMLNPRIASPAFQFFGIEGSSSSVEYSQGLGAFGLVPEYNASTAEGNAAVNQRALISVDERFGPRRLRLIARPLAAHREVNCPRETTADLCGHLCPRWVLRSRI